MTATDLGTFLLAEGTLVTGLCLARIVCLRLVSPETVPSAIRSRIEQGTRLVPVILAMAVASMVIGAVLRIVVT